MNKLEALILGMVQGITEFLPISSSAHLKLAKYFLGIQNEPGQIFFDLTCHLGTMIALLFYLKQDISKLIFHEPHKLKWLLIALMPLIPSYFLLKPLCDYFSPIGFLGGGLFITSLILFLGTKSRSISRNKCYYRDSLFIGSMQAIALIPGISRSASTICTARILGWEAKEAVRFSFLLALPTVIGANLLEFTQLVMTHTPLPSFTSCFIGFCSSLGLGVIGVRYALPFLEKGILKPFAWYSLVASLLISIYMIFYGQ